MGRHKNDYIFAPDKKRSDNRGCIFIVLALLLAVVATALLVNAAGNEKLELRSEKIAVMGLDKSYEGFTVLHLSDLHAAAVGSDLEIWRKMLFGKSYQAVVMSGDMVGQTGEFEPLLSLIHTLKQINAAAPIYLIAGDDDPSPILATPRGTPEVLADWVLAAVKAGAIYLDAPVRQEVGKKAVWFVPEYLYDVDAAGMLGSLQKQKESMETLGQQYEAEGAANYRALDYRIDTMERTLAALKIMLSTDLQMAVSHAPLSADYIRTSIEWANQDAVFNFRNIDLLFAGHYCAGQWRLPMLGAIYVPDHGWFPPDDGIVGMQRVNSVNQYISGGLGASDYYPMKGRLLNTPSISLLTMTGRIK
ncbi:MAG: hypothetical protein RR379_10265 [Clostridia bacterium]